MFRASARRHPAKPALFHRIVAAVLRAIHVRRTRQHLVRLEPHLLRDIGLTQGQAHQEATRSPWDAPQTWRQDH